MKKTAILLALFAVTIGQSQMANNNLQGYFKDISGSNIYSYFSFDNNGKVNIMGMDNGDYFIKNDTLIVFPDKSLFKFKVEKDKLIGVSNWVQDGVWLLEKDSIVINNRKTETVAQNRANLLNEYYEKTRKKNNQMELMFDENLMIEYKKTIESLCDRGLPRACFELLGLKIMDDMGGFAAAMNPEKSKPMTENPAIIALANKLIGWGEIEGYTQLANYYTMLKQEQKAKENFEKAINAGSTKAGLIVLELDAKKEIEIPKTTVPKKTIKKKKLKK